MAWNAYPWKDGKLIECPIGMHSGCYGDCLEEMTHGLSVRHQSNDIEKEPSWDFETVKRVLDNHTGINGWEYYRDYFKGTNVTAEVFMNVIFFLKWCVDHECGIWFSF